jgi:hypothetical protein
MSNNNKLCACQQPKKSSYGQVLERRNNQTVCAVSTIKSARDQVQKEAIFLPFHILLSFFYKINLIINFPSRLGGVMVGVLAIRHSVRGFKESRGDGFLRAIKIRGTLSLGGNVKS